MKYPLHVKDKATVRELGTPQMVPCDPHMSSAFLDHPLLLSALLLVASQEPHMKSMAFLCLTLPLSPAPLQSPEGWSGYFHFVLKLPVETT